MMLHKNKKDEEQMDATSTSTQDLASELEDCHGSDCDNNNASSAASDSFKKKWSTSTHTASRRNSNNNDNQNRLCVVIGLVLALFALLTVMVFLVLVFMVPGAIPCATSTKRNSGQDNSANSVIYRSNQVHMEGLLPVSTVSVLQNDPTSPQALAMEWLVRDPNYSRIDNTTTTIIIMNNRLVQRFVLATLYYSTDGMNSWTHQDRWLDYETHECEWYHRASSTSFTLSLEQTNSYEYYKDTMVHCDNDGMLRHLWMVKNNLRGSLPAELFLLSSLQSISMEKNPGLTAQIPSQLGLLSDLAVLFLDNNNHTGSGTYLSCGQKRKIMPKFTCN